MILTGPYLFAIAIPTVPKSPTTIRPCSNPRFREALVGKMLIPKPFIVVKILDSDRVLLDIIKSCLPWERGGGGAAWEKNSY